MVPKRAHVTLRQLLFRLLHIETSIYIYIYIFFTEETNIWTRTERHAFPYLVQSEVCEKKTAGLPLAGRDQLRERRQQKVKSVRHKRVLIRCHWRWVRGASRCAVKIAITIMELYSHSTFYPMLTGFLSLPHEPSLARAGATMAE